MNENDRVRIGEFEVDLDTGELVRNGAKANIPVQPLKILVLLLQKPGELVTREELEKSVWADTFVDTEHSLNAAIKRLRALLCDDAENPRYIETIPRRGYRFIGAFELIRAQTSERTGRAAPEKQSASLELASQQTDVRPPPIRTMRWRLVCLAGSAFLLILGSIFLRHPVARLMNNHGAALQQDGQVGRAIPWYQRALMFDPGYPEAHYNLAYAYEELFQYEKAVTHYEQAIQMDDRFYEAYNNLARLYILRHNEPAAALALIDRALQNNPEAPLVRYSLHKNRGWANLKLGYLKQAQSDLNTAISLARKRPGAHCLLAQVQQAQSEDSKGDPEWEACLAYASVEGDAEANWLHLAQERLGRH